MSSKLFLVTCSLAFFCYIFLGHLVLQPAGIGSNPLTLKQVALGYLFFGSIIFVYSKRKEPPYDAIWGMLRMFLLVLFGILVWGYIKGRYLDSRKK